MNLVSIFLYTSQSVVLDDKIHIFYEFDNVCIHRHHKLNLRMLRSS